jgi:hypothetical protein
MIVKNVVFCSVNVQQYVLKLLQSGACVSSQNILYSILNKECCIFCMWNVIRVLKNDLLLPLYKYFLTFLLGMKTLKLNI